MIAFIRKNTKLSLGIFLFVSVLGIFAFTKIVGDFLFSEEVPVDTVYFDPGAGRKNVFPFMEKIFPEKKHVVMLPKKDKISEETRARIEKDARSCNGNKKVILDDGKFSCRNKLSFKLPKDFTLEMVKEKLPEVASKFYRDETGKEVFSFIGDVAGDAILVRNRPPENSLEQLSDIYIGTLKNQEGKVTAIVRTAMVGEKDGEAYFEFHGMDPCGDAYHRLPESEALNDSNVTLEQLRDKYRYPFETFPSVTETMADGFVQDYLRENKVDGMTVDRVGYSTVYDYRGDDFGSYPANAFHEYIVTDSYGQQASLLVSIDDGRIIDQAYVKWLTEANDYNDRYAMRPSVPDYSVDPPQQPRFTVNWQLQQLPQ